MKTRIIALLLIILQIMLFTSSCTQSDKNDSEAFEDTSNKTTVFKSKDIELPDTSLYWSSLSNADGMFSLMGSGSDEYCLYSFDESGENGTMKDIPTSDDGRIFNYFLLSDSRYVYTYPVIDGAGKYTDMKITFASSGNEEIFSVTADSLLGAGTYSALQNNYAGIGFGVTGASAYGDDEYILVTSHGIFTLDLSGGMKLSIFPEGSYAFSHFTVTSSGDGIVLLYDMNTGGAKLGYIDTEAGKVSDFTGDITGYITSSTKLISGNGKYSFYFTGSDSLYGAVTSKNTSEAPVQVINLIDSNINPSDITAIASVSDEKFIVSARNETSDTELYILRMIPKDQLIEKTSIVLAHADGNFPYNQEVMDFNKSSDLYKIEIKDYSIYNGEESHDYNAGMQMLVNEIIAGDIPDVMHFNMHITPNFYNNLMRKGAFTDLYAFFDNDPDVSRETVVPFILEPFETDGKLYPLAMYYSLSVHMAERADIPYDTWSYEKMFALMDSLDDTTLINEWIIAWTQRGSDRELGGYMLSEGLSDFIDYKNAKVSFDSDMFIKILEKLKESNRKSSNLRSNEIEYKTVISSSPYIGDFDDYIKMLYAPRNRQYEDLIFIPQPSIEEQNISDVRADISSSANLCIMENSKNKDGAWEFFKSLMAEKIQDVEISDWRYITSHINRNSFERYMDECVSLTYCFTERGMFKFIGETAPDDLEAIRASGFEVTITQEHADTFKNLFYNAKGKQEHDYALHGILLDEILPFMYGENSKTAAETAKAIQSRASIFISETN